jgi:CRISPR-associated protein Csd2
MSQPIQNRYDFVLLFDVRDGNPNGDPDAGNLPRVDPETGHGLVTDVCLKRKVRNYVGLVKSDQPPHRIYVKERAVLNQFHEEAHQALGLDQPAGEKEKKKHLAGDKVDQARRWMCDKFFDIRTFGAVMSTEVNCGQVRGPVQLTFARSVEPVVPLEHSITRMAVTNERDLEKERTMGRKYTVSYGLYRAHGFISAPLANHPANGTGFNDDDLSLLWEALGRMFDHDRSAARGEMTTRKLLAFKHDSAYGNAPAHVLFDAVQVRRAGGGAGPARSFADFEVIKPEASALPQGVSLLELV